MIKRIKQWFINKRDYYANRHVITNMMTPVENKDTAPTPPDERERRPGETYTEYCIRVPVQFQPTDGVKLSYRGQPLPK